MYAIRSYYELLGGEARRFQQNGIGDADLTDIMHGGGLGGNFHRSRLELIARIDVQLGNVRITSYNVCYTKLLRVMKV